jgi:flagellar biosynthesis/type III secretory pathway protein FliH
VSDRTPTTEQIRKSLLTEHVSDSEFDRWLTQVKAQAWQEGYREGLHAHQSLGNPYLKKDKK